MRILVLALAILLLPLRGWLGDAMAVERVQQQVAHASHAMHDMAAMDDTMAAAAPVSASAAKPDCPSSCTHCQLCHSVAMTVWAAVPATGEAPRAAPSLAPVAFASAEPAPGLKPPIS